MKRFACPMALLCLAAAAVPVRATVVFSDDFDTDHSANWTFTSSIASEGDQANDGFGNEGDAFYDYSSVVPSANGAGGTTRGMRFAANIGVNGYFGGATMTLNNQTFDFANKAYRIKAQVWLNYYGGTTSGTTEEAMMGVGANPGQSQYPGDSTFNSVQFDTSTDGDTSTDWRAYKTPWPLQGPTDTNPGQPAVGRVQQGESGVYAADPTGATAGTADLNSSHSYYTSHFPGGENPPAVQQANFPNQATGSVGLPASPGTVAFGWHTWTVTTTPNGGPISYYVSDAAGNDVLIATIQGGTTNPYTLAGNSIYFGMFDINSGGTPLDAAYSADKLLFGLVDNVSVEDVSAPVHHPGDTNSDGVVDLTDLNNVLNNFGSTGSGNPGDDDSSGVVDLTDLNNVLNNFGTTYAAAALNVVPEPASLSLLALGATSLLTRRRRSR